VGLVLIHSLQAAPFKKEEEEAPGYEINPHFGFRRYFEIRYEPLSEPFVYNPPEQEYQPQQDYQPQQVIKSISYNLSYAKYSCKY